MEEVTRKRIMRLLEGLPEAQLYQVLDYIEFLSARYAAAASRKPDAFQRFAERVEDQMRVRALAPKAMKGTMKIMSTAGRVLEGVRDLGKDLVTPPPGATSSPASAPGSKPAEASGAEPRPDAGKPAADAKPAEIAAKPAEAEVKPAASPEPEEGNGRRTESGA